MCGGSVQLRTETRRPLPKEDLGKRIFNILVVRVSSWGTHTTSTLTTGSPPLAGPDKCLAAFPHMESQIHTYA